MKASPGIISFINIVVVSTKRVVKQMVEVSSVDEEILGEALRKGVSMVLSEEAIGETANGGCSKEGIPRLGLGTEGKINSLTNLQKI